MLLLQEEEEFVDDRFVAAASDARTRPLLKTSHGEVAKRVAESAAGGRDAAVGG